MRNFAQKITAVVFLAFAGFCIWKAAPGVIADAQFALNPPAQASAQPIASPVSDSAVKNKRLITTPIQDLRAGMRVYGRNPLAEDADRDLPEPNPETWRLVRIRMEHKPGEFVDGELLRPLGWKNESGAKPKEQIWLELAEMHTAGWAEVLAIEPCPPIESGTNPIITGTFRHVADEVVDLWIEGDDKPITCTAEHPFWSKTQAAYVAANELQPGELVVSALGKQVAVKSIRVRHERQTVYGLEVFGEHVYHVGLTSVLAHNASGSNGKWVQKARRLTESTRHQARMTGKPIVTRFEKGRIKHYFKEYKINGHHFDDFFNGRLVDYKNPGFFRRIINKNDPGKFADWYMKLGKGNNRKRRGASGLRHEARQQLKAAEGMPVVWKVGDASLVKPFKNALRNIPIAVEE